MRVANILNSYRYSFKGTVQIIGQTDDHQEATNTAKCLTNISKDAKTLYDAKKILYLHCADFYGGVYSRDLMPELYTTFKKENPDVEMVTTIGNNDPISIKDEFAPKNPDDNRTPVEFFFDSIKKMQKAGIHVVCANLRDRQTGECPTWVKPYTVIERSGDRIFVTGFCINRLPNNKLNTNNISQIEAFKDLQKDIEREQPDSIIILNHDYADTATALSAYAKAQGINIDFILCGHDHDNPPNIPEFNCYFPKTFAQSLFKAELEIKNKVSRILNPREIMVSILQDIAPEYETIIRDYEEKSEINHIVSPHVLNLPKRYCHPAPCGTFIADGMKELANAEVAFFASNAVRLPIYYKAGENVTNADVRKTITFPSTIQTGELDVEGFKEVVNSALQDRVRLGEQNGKFLQFSSNVKIIATRNEETQTCKVKQIYINNEPLLDESGAAINSSRKIKCAFDNFIPSAKRSEALTKTPKEDVFVNDKLLSLRDVLVRQLETMEQKYEKGTTYPQFELVEVLEY